jgi:hypothetical protein
VQWLFEPTLPTVPIAAKSHKLGQASDQRDIDIFVFSPPQTGNQYRNTGREKLCFVVTGHNFSRATLSIFGRAIFIFLGGPQAH